MRIGICFYAHKNNRMDFTTMREEPLFRKCCFYIPLRWCLQTWALIKVVADVLALSYFMLMIAIVYSYELNGIFRTLSVLHVVVLAVVALLVDVGFLIALIVGILMKSFKILRVFYFYEFYAMAADTTIIAIICVNVIEIDVIRGLIYATIGVIYILLDVCISMTVKSEMIKLRNKDQYDFSRMPAIAADVEGTGKFRAEEE